MSKQASHVSAFFAVVLVVLVVGIRTSGAQTIQSPPPEPEPPWTSGPGAGPGALQMLLTQLISGGLAAATVYSFLESQVGCDLIQWLSPLLAPLGFDVSEVKRYVAIALAAAVSLAAYAVAMAFGFPGMPRRIAGIEAPDTAPQYTPKRSAMPVALGS